jgi:hypothetical protein
MNHSKRFLGGLAVGVAFAASLAFQQARAAASDEEIANGLDPITTGQAPGNYAGGSLLAGEYFPVLAKSADAERDEEIANGLDPITTGQAMGNFQGGKVLLGEYLPPEERVVTAKRKQ